MAACINCVSIGGSNEIVFTWTPAFKMTSFSQDGERKREKERERERKREKERERESMCVREEENVEEETYMYL